MLYRNGKTVDVVALLMFLSVLLVSIGART